MDSITPFPSSLRLTPSHSSFCQPSVNPFIYLPPSPPPSLTPILSLSFTSSSYPIPHHLSFFQTSYSPCTFPPSLLPVFLHTHPPLFPSSPSLLTPSLPPSLPPYFLSFPEFLPSLPLYPPSLSYLHIHLVSVSYSLGSASTGSGFQLSKSWSSPSLSSLRSTSTGSPLTSSWVGHG